MKSQIELLELLNRKIEKMSCILCDKLDQVIVASGGTPSLYNNWVSTVVAPSNSFTTPQAHSISVSVIGGAGDVADVIVGGVSQSWPPGYSVSVEATTLFNAGHFEIEATSTATVIVATINATV